MDRRKKRNTDRQTKHFDMKTTYRADGQKRTDRKINIERSKRRCRCIPNR